MGYKENIVSGELPNSGAIFMSNIGTKKECFRQKLFGLPSAMSSFVLHVKKGMILFLFEFQKRQLFGVFRATSNGQINIMPNAFKSTGKQFPAQVRFTFVWNCSPLAENEFQDVIRDNYFSGKKFNFGLSEDQVCKLMMLFFTKKIPKEHPVRNFWRHGDKLADGDGRFDDHRKNLARDRIGFVNKEDFHAVDNYEYLDDEGKEVDESSDRLGYISKEDSHGLDIREYLDEVKEVDDQVYLNGNFVEKVNNFNCGRGQGNRSVMVERPQKDNGDGFLTNYMTQCDDFVGDGSRQAILGKHLDHSLGGLRRVAEAGLHVMRDVDDGHDVHNCLGETRGITNEDRFFMMEKIKETHDIEDGYRHIFTEPHEKHFGKTGAASNDAKFLMDDIANKSKDFMDDNRIQDGYHVTNGFWQNHSAQHVGGPCDRGSQPINDGRFFGYESEQRTLTEHPPFKPRAAGIKPVFDKDFCFGSVASSTHDSIRGVVSTNDNALSHCKQNTSNSAGNPISEAQDSSISEQLRHPYEFRNIGKAYDCGLPHSTSCDTRMITMPIPYDPEVPDIRLRPSFFAAGPSSGPVDNCPFYPSSKEIHTSVSMNKTLPYHSQNELSMQYFDDYALSSKSHHTASCHETRGTHRVEGNRVLKIDSREGSQGPCFSERASLSSPRVETAENVIKGHRSHGFSSSMSPLSANDNRYLGEPRSKYMHKVSESSHASRKPFQDNQIHHDKEFCQPCEDADKRVSVFARLTLAPEALRHGLEPGPDEQHDLNASVNEVMKMLEKVVSSPIKRTGKSISAFKQDDDISASKIVDYELPKVKMEPDADGSILQETRLVDFKRRKKANKSLDDKSKEKSAGPTERERSVGSVEINSCKRRRLVRPVFDRNDGVTAAKNTQPTSLETTPLKDGSSSPKAVESLEKVDTPMKSVQRCQQNVIEGEDDSQVEGNGDAENHQVLDLFVKGRNWREEPQEKDAVDAMNQVASSKDNQKMCGWIEW